ncbi:epoxide hydrolase 4 isoform X1 [Polypterus senegalus]|uniref:epoxide hydrolase 4 isoform X1 n=1 Tax=Polypterus senegalus TaxID=55291 RepID=UPI001964337C|nr:epoxide hydrolase 4 isoform X1 [Polypterus senegalus]
MFRLFAALLLLPTRVALRLVSWSYWSVTYGTCSITSCMVLVGMVWRTVFNPRKTLYWRVRRKPPACLEDPSLGSHYYIRMKNSGLRFHYVTAGDRGRPLMLFLHGFLEMWYSWRYQLREFKNEYCAVAIDLRGCGDSDCPRRREDYKLGNLLEDVKDIIHTLGYRHCVLVGHDFGGMLAWHFAITYPEMVQQLVIINAPHPAFWQEYIFRHPTQLMKSSFAFFFQIPFLPEVVMTLEDFRVVKNLLTGQRFGIQNPSKRLTEQEVEAYLYSLSQQGRLTGPLNYYRNLFSSVPAKCQDVNVPCLLIWGERDMLFGMEVAKWSGAYVRNSFKFKVLPGSSRLVQQDYPDHVNTLVKTFLKQTCK